MDKTTKESIDIHAIILIGLKNWKLFLVSVVVILGLAFVYLKLTAPVYQINANIMIKEEAGGSGSMQSAIMKGMGLSGKSSVDDEIEVISSYSIIRNAVKELELNKSYSQKKWMGLKSIALYTKTPIRLVVDNSILDTLQTSVSFKVSVNKKGIATIKGKALKKNIGTIKTDSFPIQMKTAYGTYTFEKTADFKPGKDLSMNIMVEGYSTSAEQWKKRISIKLANKRSNAIKLSIKDAESTRGRMLLDRVIELYNKDGIDDKNILAQNTAVFLDERLVLLGKDLEEAEIKVEQYKEANQLVDFGTEIKLALEKSSDAREKIVEIETQSSIINMIEEYVKSPDKQFSLIPIALDINNDAMSESIAEYNNYLLERLSLLRSVRSGNTQLETINERLEEMRKNLTLTIENAKRSLAIRQKEMEGQESNVLSRINDAPRKEREFIIIKRQQAIKEQLYVFLLQKREENDLTLAISTPNAKVIDKAYHQVKPVAPKKMITLAIALLLGFVIPVIYLYLKDLLNTKFTTREEVERLTSLPILGEISLQKEGKHIVIREGDTSSIAELFRLVRTNASFMINGESEKSILVTSSTSGEGKTFFSCNFALSLALSKKRVVLIGLDIRAPKLAAYLNIHDQNKGITNYLSSSKVTLDDIIIPQFMDPMLDVILAGPIPPNPNELLLSNRLDELFSVLRDRYDYIIIDSAPIGMVSDSFSLIRVSDATIYVTRANYADKKNIETINVWSEQGRLKKVGIVVNGTKARQGYGYGHEESLDKKKKK